MTKTKSKIIGSVIIAVMLLVSSMLLLAGCGGVHIKWLMAHMNITV